MNLYAKSTAHQACTDLSELIPSSLSSYLSEMSSSKKLELLKSFELSHVLGLYRYFSHFMDALYAEELRKRDEYSQSLAALLTGYLKASTSNADEKRILLKMLEDVLPVLYYVEKELNIDPSEINGDTITKEDFEKFLLYLAVNLIKISDASDIPIIDLKTCELKRYSRSRITLEEEDQIIVEKKKDQLKLKEICYFQVGNYKVLCGFFTDDGKWLSESHLDNEVRKRILEKYQLASRSAL